MDVFDEFEFKPLTDGLGFNKKAQDIKKEIEDSQIAKAQVSAGHDLPSVPKSFLEKELLGAMPKGATITSEKKVSQAASLQFKSQLDSILDSQPEIKKELRKQKPLSTPFTMPFEEIPTSFPAMLFDAIFSFALSLLFLIALVFVTRIDVMSIIKATSLYLTSQVSLLILYIAISQLYIVVARTFCGQTMGEWAFDVRLGKPEEQNHQHYPLKVLGRALVMTVTGVFVMPILSIIMGRDIAASVSGLKLYRIQ